MPRYEVRVLWRKKGEHRHRIIKADSLEKARQLAFQKFGPNRGVRLAKNQESKREA